MAAVQILVTGGVQGVGYRAWCRRKALSLDVRGFVRNLDDGRVEVHAEGEARAIDQLVVACWQGPAHATVDDVVTAAKAVRGASDFVIAHDAARPE
jgi:acylphosphatase